MCPPPCPPHSMARLDLEELAEIGVRTLPPSCLSPSLLTGRSCIVGFRPESEFGAGRSSSVHTWCQLAV